MRKVVLLSAALLLIASEASARGRILLTGSILGVDGVALAGERITLTVPLTQAFPDGFVLKIGSQTYFTDVNGNLPGDVYAYQGGVYNITIGESGEPIQVRMPPVASIHISAILGEIQEPQPADLIDRIVINNTGDYTMSVENPPQFGPAYLTTEVVRHFTLTSNSSAGQHKIQELLAASTAGDALVYGQSGANLISLVVTSTLDATVVRVGDQLLNATYIAGSLPTLGNGSQVFCSDCMVSSVCVSGGTGALAVRINGVWSCGLEDDSIFAGSATLTDRVDLTGSTSHGIMGMRVHEVNLTCNSGASTCSTASLIVNPSIVIGVQSQVTTAIVGCTTFKIGDGTTTNKWAAAVAATVGSTSGMADFLAAANPMAFYQTATSVVLTCNTGVFTSGVVRLVEYAIENQAPAVFTATSTPTVTITPTVTMTPTPTPAAGGDSILNGLQPITF